MSVYKIVNKTTGELIYIGQTRNLEIRISWHRSNSYTLTTSNLYKHIHLNGGWDNMEFVVLVTEDDVTKRIIFENTLQLELNPMFYWICNRRDVPRKIHSKRHIKRVGKRLENRGKTVLMPGITLDLTGVLATPPLLAPDCALNLSKVAQFPT
jgi:hypothetical protein